MSEDLQLLVHTAEQSIRDAASVADTDRARPAYHFRAPSQWMDDPNGIIFRNGEYHMMYSLNPHSSVQRAGMVYKTSSRTWDPNDPDWTGGITVWGHAKSTDLVHWEHLPIALYPQVDKGEHFIWFGCTVINDDGVPMAIYTAIGPDLRPEDTAQQWAATGSDDLTTWQSLPTNPLLTDAIHGVDSIGEWRDPFLFQHEGRTFMVLGGRTSGSEGRPVVTLYEATTSDYTGWVYRGIIFEHPDSSVPSAECPNFAFIDGKWVLLLSPHKAVEWYVGDLDLDSFNFTVENSGIVDHSTNFYATNVLWDDGGRCLMWGAIEGFTERDGWNGCVSLPRELHISTNGELTQRVATELQRLRTGGFEISQTTFASQTTTLLGNLANIGTSEFEIAFAPASGQDWVLMLASERGSLTISFHPEHIVIGDRAFDVPGLSDITNLHIFVDRQVIEVHVDARVVITAITPVLDGEGTVSLESRGPTTIRQMAAHELDVVDLFTAF